MLWTVVSLWRILLQRMRLIRKIWAVKWDQRHIRGSFIAQVFIDTRFFALLSDMLELLQLAVLGTKDKLHGAAQFEVIRRTRLEVAHSRGCLDHWQLPWTLDSVDFEDFCATHKSVLGSDTSLQHIRTYSGEYSCDEEILVNAAVGDGEAISIFFGVMIGCVGLGLKGCTDWLSVSRIKWSFQMLQYTIRSNCYFPHVGLMSEE